MRSLIQAPTWRAVRGVCFDLGGTLVRITEGPTTARLARILRITLESARREMERHAKRQILSPDELARHLSMQFGCPSRLEELAEVLLDARRKAHYPALFDDVEPTLRILRKRGYQLFALSNIIGSSVPGPAPSYAALVDRVVYSAEIGYVKPETEAFRAVEDGAGLRPDELLHVGDSLRADVGGALRAGWHAAYLRRGGPSGGGMPPRTGVVSLRRLATLADVLPGPDMAKTPQRPEVS